MHVPWAAAVAGSEINLIAVVWLAPAAAAALATFALVQIGSLSARRLAVPAALVLVAMVGALASSTISVLLAVPYIALPLACSATALAAATGHQRAVALVCIVLVIVGGEVYLAGGFGGFVLLACGYAAATAFVVLSAAIAVVRSREVVRTT